MRSFSRRAGCNRRAGFLPSACPCLILSAPLERPLPTTDRSLSCIFKTVIRRFFYTHPLEFRFRKRREAPVNLDAQVFRSRYLRPEHIDFFVQRTMIKRLDHFALDKVIQIGEVRDHPRRGIYVTRHTDLNDVVVPMSECVVAL